MDSLAQQAINSALKSDWSEAIKINHLILEENPTDVEALNRLARAYAETNNLTKAKKYANEALAIDPFNSIAQKALLKWKRAKASNVNHKSESVVGPDAFLEEPGKTKIVNLINLGGSHILEEIDTAQEVTIQAHSHKVSVNTLAGKYIGRLPDDLSARLRTLVKGGNKYCAYVKSIEPGNVKVFIKETTRGKDYLNTPSFPAEKIDYISYAPPELVSSERPFRGHLDEENI